MAHGLVNGPKVVNHGDASSGDVFKNHGEEQVRAAFTCHNMIASDIHSASLVHVSMSPPGQGYTRGEGEAQARADG